jgi:hypothetical protein
MYYSHIPLLSSSRKAVNITLLIFNALILLKVMLTLKVSLLSKTLAASI